jgi:CDP-diacylglycerol--glycerol-3-phosphate 3-phosphatidyltransferase
MSEKEIDKESRAYKIAAGKGVMNLPNKLTISRVVMIPIFVLFFYLHFTGHYFVALAVFALASLTDFFDGRIARKYNLVTNLGKFLDPIADKILVSTALIIMLTKPLFFTIFTGNWAIIVAGVCVAIILGREMLVSGFRMVAANAGIVIAADKIGKYKTASQDFSIVILLVSAGFYEIFGDSLAIQVVNYIGLALFAIATLLTIISGINYIVKNIQVLKV